MSRLVVQAVGSGGSGGPRRRTRRGVWVSDSDSEGETRMGKAAHRGGEEDAHGGGWRTARAAMAEVAMDGIEIFPAAQPHPPALQRGQGRRPRQTASTDGAKTNSRQPATRGSATTKGRDGRRTRGRLGGREAAMGGGREAAGGGGRPRRAADGRLRWADGGSNRRRMRRAAGQVAAATGGRQQKKKNLGQGYRTHSDSMLQMKIE
ncbi:hypothetical protein PVAP13_2KG095400 [Panicum virgatum]|uniref:Uncharacterized protein n=1 Tax=Panicum virgatum TaxID=38727 RepID=A0A8T0VZ77_PANVG|nr:hypothetical protein PVAP13_2KG095400 [Panicum virgatum]